MNTQTHTPVKYEDLTPEMLKEICNGCGGKGGKITPPYAAMYHTDCNHHDYGYFKGGSWWDRMTCDWNLLISMQKDALLFKWKIHKVGYFSTWALIYFTGVRVAGWKFFSYNTEKRYPEIGEIKC